MSAFAHAVEVGSQVLELDVYLTADGQAVVHHDPDLLRVWGDPREVEATPFEELQGLRALPAIKLHFLGESYYPSEAERGQHPPLLEQVFKAFPDTFVNMELKSQTRATAAEVSRVIDKHGRRDWVIWGAKDTELA
jgi:glycerophosphoryl diester phosphodiesterase